MLKIKNYEIHLLESGRFALDGGAVFGVIPKPLWSRKVDVDEENRVTMSLTTPVIIGKDRKILIDSGVGNKLEEKLKKIYKVDFNYDIEKSLTDFGIKPQEITDVIITHLHFDHVGGCVKQIDGRYIPSFPNARYYVQRKQFDWANNPTELDRASFMKENFMPLLENNVLDIIDGEFYLTSDIVVYVTDGHTPGLQHVFIRDSENPVFFASDLIPMSHHIPTTWITAFDLFPVDLIKEKKYYLDQAARNNWTIIFPHDPYIKAVKVKKGEKYFEISEIIEKRDNE